MKLFKLFFLLFILCFILCGFVINSSTAKCTILKGGTIIAAWQSKDELGKDTIQGVIGSAKISPSFWILTNLSNAIDGVQSKKPTFFSNSYGDVYVLWEYLDANSKVSIALATLYRGSIVWDVSTVVSSKEKGRQEFYDEVRALALLSAFDQTTLQNEVWFEDLAKP